MAIIGIDLGTSNSAAAVLRDGRPVTIPSAEGVSFGGKAFPSYVAITVDGQTLVGEPARRQTTANPEGTVTAFKRKMGQREQIKLGDLSFSPEQLSAFLLQKIKRDAEAFLGEPVTKAVVAVPAYFDDNQRNATKDACGIAGLEVARLVNEPTAASLAYGLDRAGEELTIAVIDLGGGTLDVTLMEFGNGVFEVKATSGDTQLGGTDMNQLLFEYLADQFRNQSGIDIRSDRKAEARLLEAAEIAKIDLTAANTTHISLPYLAINEGDQQNFEFNLNRAEMERIIQPVIERCRPPVEQALADAAITSKEIDRVIFVGGPTRMPVVRKFFEEMLGRSAESGIDPMECVAHGAAIQAGVLSGEVGNLVLVDVTPLTLGVETLGGVATALVARNTPIPVTHTEIFTTAVDMQKAVTVHIYQGERLMSPDNTSLGEFTLEGIIAAPRGIPRIDVTFDIDSNGILNVTAKDQATGKSQSITITGSTRLSNDEKQRMIKEAAQYSDQDTQKREAAEKLNIADTVCYEGEKLLVEYSHQLADELRNRIEEGLRQTREAITNEDAALATERAEQLQRVLKEAGVAIYAQTQRSGIYKETRTPGASVGSGHVRATRHGRV